MARPNRQNRRNRPRGKGAGGNRSYLEPPTDRQLNRQTRAATNQRFRPVERAIGGDIRASNRRVGEQGDWWNNYLQTVSQGRADTQAAYDKAAATGQAQVAQASQIDNANTAKLNEEAAKSAALRGANTSTAPQERAAAAQAQRNYLAAAQGNATAMAGANQFAYLTDQQRIGVGQSIASRQKEQRRGLSFRQDLRTTRRERGDFAVTDRAEREEKARNYLLQRGAFGLDKRKQTADEREGAADAAQDERENREDNAQDERASIRGAKDGGGGGLTPTQQRAIKRGRQNAWTEANALYRSSVDKKGRPDYPQTDADWATFVRTLAEQDGIDPVDARWATEKLRKKLKREAANTRHHPSD